MLNKKVGKILQKNLEMLDFNLLPTHARLPNYLLAFASFVTPLLIRDWPDQLNTLFTRIGIPEIDFSNPLEANEAQLVYRRKHSLR